MNDFIRKTLRSRIDRSIAQRLSPFWINIADSLSRGAPHLKVPQQLNVFFLKPVQPGSKSCGTWTDRVVGTLRPWSSVAVCVSFSELAPSREVLSLARALTTTIAGVLTVIITRPLTALLPMVHSEVPRPPPTSVVLVEGILSTLAGDSDRGLHLVYFLSRRQPGRWG